MTTPDVQQKEGARDYLVVTLERQTCALPVEMVLEIRAVPVLGTERGWGDVRVGHMEVRGRRLPVVDLRRLAGLTPWRRRSEAAVLLVRSGEKRCGLLVDRVAEIIALRDSDIDAWAEAPGLDPSLVVGVALRPEPVVVLDGPALLAACRDVNGA
ncbi:MAG: chemotaxis protein CheW [Gemmatimonadota bacterium]